MTGVDAVIVLNARCRGTDVMCGMTEHEYSHGYHHGHRASTTRGFTQPHGRTHPGMCLPSEAQEKKFKSRPVAPCKVAPLRLYP